MKNTLKNLTLIFFCFLAGLAGANVTPILTGTGKILFPEATPNAQLVSSGGRLAIAAGETNQNILLLPTGSGSVAMNTTDPTFGGKVGAGALLDSQWRTPNCYREFGHRAEL